MPILWFELPFFSKKESGKKDIEDQEKKLDEQDLDRDKDKYKESEKETEKAEGGRLVAPAEREPALDIALNTLTRARRRGSHIERRDKDKLKKTDKREKKEKSRTKESLHKARRKEIREELGLGITSELNVVQVVNFSEEKVAEVVQLPPDPEPLGKYSHLPPIVIYNINK